jgi:predicted MPP superfamily phosphohydrolase
MSPWPSRARGAAGRARGPRARLGACLAGVASLLASGCCSVPPAQPLGAPLGEPARIKIAFVGDLQRTGTFEALVREQNDEERPRVVAHIAANHPSLVVMLGDLVSDGSSDCQWAAFDELVAPLRLAAVPCVTAIGNHDLRCHGYDDLPNLYDRFPLLERKPYHLFETGGVAIVVLDSNHDDMGSEAWDGEKRWLSDTLRQLDGEAAVKATVVALHHPPYTNSTVTDDDPVLVEELLPVVTHSRTTVAMIAGHAHGYEHFEKCGKHLLVSGGGGGPRVTLRPLSDPRRHPDRMDKDYPPPDRRPFNVVWLRVVADGVLFDVMGLPKGEVDFRLLDSFKVPWPSDEPPPPCAE